MTSLNVRCPEGCLFDTGFGKANSTARRFEYVDGTEGTMRYCPECGAEMVDAPGAGPTVVA